MASAPEPYPLDLTSVDTPRCMIAGQDIANSLGVIFNVFLLGMMWVQTYVYLNTNERGTRWIKWMVLFLFVVDNVNSGMDVAMIYDYTIKDFGNYEKIQFTNAMFNAEPVTTGIIASVVHFFYAWRITVLTRRLWLGILIVIMSLISTLCAIGGAIGITILKAQFSGLQRVEQVVIIWLVMAAVTDTVITAGLVLHLHKQRTIFPQTEDLLTKLMRVVIPTGMITAVVAILNLVLYLTTQTSVPLIFNLPLAKLYTNCVLSSLNARKFWLSSASDQGSTSTGIFKKHNLRSDGVLRFQHPPSDGGIQITTTSMVHCDRSADAIELTTVKSPGVRSLEEGTQTEEGYKLYYH
ncbi:hypothetical protein GLOTRDRAFT_127382 [Gloeophyllum trabeum ATCC 11539]|uniref:DUF6534 domain-containing protein n=1 Tax=Gloeophyllum trabeum (strain ATCC 11539 / FP-39264 / Madison 617) TaxID=670483 RepID=S7QAT9_GLOTA|nr:uncharacterized protein GLOTRDRAFT_127382 [Gloeophyllum trabeum ATCC 11539]EPQ57001.1 hypothetical protein GLOTRDRAFT_127382 [Gloeophyllum trabeum ATCC 11539]